MLTMCDPLYGAAQLHWAEWNSFLGKTAIDETKPVQPSYVRRGEAGVSTRSAASAVAKGLTSHQGGTKGRFRNLRWPSAQTWRLGLPLKKDPKPNSEGRIVRRPGRVPRSS